jgi:putative membrane protein
MLVSSKIPIVRVMFVFLRAYVLLFVGTAAVAVALVHALELRGLELSTLPLTVVGVALSIFLGFRTNSAYDRYWEARKLWGALVNVSRHFSQQVVEYIHAEGGGAVGVVHTTVLTRHCAYVHALRCHLRRSDPRADEHVLRLVPEVELARFAESTNLPAAMLRANRATVVEAARKGWLGEERLRAMDVSFAEMLAAQGGCERILNTPIPVAYVYFARRLVLWYGAMLPFGMVAELGLLTLVVGPLAAIVFVLIDETGRLIQDPFATGVYGLPLSALSLTIERNVLELASPRPELPPAPEPVGPNRELLM